VIREHCYFEDEILLVEAVGRSLRIEDSQLPVLAGTRLRADGILSLCRSDIAGTVRLNQANITGQTRLRRTTITPRQGLVAAAAEGLTVDGYLGWAELEAHGSIDLSRARISGSASFQWRAFSLPAVKGYGRETGKQPLGSSAPRLSS
jgi:hypothetical protein